MRIADLINPFRAADGPPPRRLVPFIRWALSGAWPALSVAAVISAASGTLEVMAALVLGAVIDATVTGDPASFWAAEAWLLFGALVFFVLLRPISFGLAAASNAIVVMPNIQPLVLSRLHRWTLGQDVTFFDNDFAGRIAQKQMQTANALTDVTSEMINTVAFALASIIGSALLLLAINGTISAALAVWVVVYLGFIRALLPRVRARAAARAGARAAVSGQIVDTITNIKTVKLFAHARHEDGAALEAMRSFRDRAIAFGWISAWFRLTLMTLAGALPVILVGGTLWFWSKGTASAGDIVAAGTIGIRIAQMSGWVSFTLMTIYANLGEIEDGMRTLTPPHALLDADGATDLPPARGEIRFDAASFAYGRRTGGVSDINLTIAAGEKIGIVGASGAGKSTLVSLLLRLYDTEAGRVLIDGHDLRGLTQESLRRQIGMVTQETAMFNRSAMDNIRYGRPDATEAEVHAAARAAEAHDFILTLRDHAGREGYAAHLGERGVKLSGGQRQRIALARAFLKDAPILVLDEATSALDSEVEAAVQAALSRLMQGKTVLAIAHRLSTIAAMDRIVVMDRGRIAEIGSHADLLAREGLYARYWTRQSGGFIGTDDAPTPPAPVLPAPTLPATATEPAE